MAAHKVAQSVPGSIRDSLYFLQAASGAVKIGRAIDPLKRLAQCQTGCFEELELIEVLDGRGYEEKVWHWAFCEAKIRGEWFEFTDEMDWALACAMRGKPWWDHLTPPKNFPLSEDPNERDDDFVDWQIGVHVALAGAAEKVGLSTCYAGKNLFRQDNDAPKREANIV